MIELYCGLIGSGKTVSAVLRAVEYMAAGGCVVSNIELDLEAVRAELKRVYGWEYQAGQFIPVTDEDMTRCHEQIPQGSPMRPVLFILDECSEWFDSLEQSRSLNAFLSFLRQSRKVAIDCIFITQDPSLVHKRIRCLAESVYWHKNFAGKWAAGLGFKLPAWFRVIHVTQFARDGRSVIRTYSRPNDSGVWKLYKTGQLYRNLGVKTGVQTDFRKAEGGVEDMKTGWKVAVVGCLIGLGWLSVLVLTANKAGAAVVASVPGASAVSVARSNPLPAGSVTVERSERYRGAGRGWVMLGDTQYRVGWMTPHGVCKAAGEWGARCVRPGTNTVVYAVRGGASDQVEQAAGDVAGEVEGGV